jgi:hypothetical protein
MLGPRGWEPIDARLSLRRRWPQQRADEDKAYNAQIVAYGTTASRRRLYRQHVERSYEIRVSEGFDIVDGRTISETCGHASRKFVSVARNRNPG